MLCGIPHLAMTSTTAAVAFTPPPRVLVVEDEVKTRDSVAEGLRLLGWRVSTAGTGADALKQLLTETLDLVLLDWMLPAGNGMEVLREVRALPVRPQVLMLTARDSVDDRVTGLEAGADDYLTKPFALAELQARCRALLRRTAAQSTHRLMYGDLVLDPRAREASRAGDVIPLTPREVDILEYLLRHQGLVVTREMLQKDVWKEPRRLTPLDNVIDVQMARLRRKLDTGDSEKLIHTIRGLGYRLGKEDA